MLHGLARIIHISLREINLLGELAQLVGDLVVEGCLRFKPLVIVDLLVVGEGNESLEHGLEAGGVVIHGRQQLSRLRGGL